MPKDDHPTDEAAEETESRWLWLRTAAVVACMVLIGIVGAEFVKGAALVAFDSGDFDKYIQPVATAAHLRDLAERTPTQTLLNILYGTGLALAVLLLLALPCLFNPGLISRGRRFRVAASYPLHLLLFAGFLGGVGSLHDPLHGGGFLFPVMVVAPIYAVWFVVAGPRAFGASFARLRSWRGLWPRDIVTAALLGMVAGTITVLVVIEVLDFSSVTYVFELRFKSAVDWAAGIEAPRFVEALKGYGVAVTMVVGLGGATLFGALVALSPVRASVRNRAAALGLALMPLVVLGIWQRTVVDLPYRLLDPGHPPNPDTWEKEVPITGIVIVPSPAGAWLKHFELKVEALAYTAGDVRATAEVLDKIEQHLGSARQWTAVTGVALQARWAILARQWKPERAMIAAMDDARRTGSVAAPLMAARLALRLPQSPAVRSTLIELGRPDRFHASATALRALSRIARSSWQFEWSEALSQAAKSAKPRLPLVKPWSSGSARGCLQTIDALPTARVHIGLFRVQRPFYIDQKGPYNVIGAASPDGHGCYRFENLPRGEYAVALLWVPPVPAMPTVKIEGSLGPLLIDERNPAADFGTLRLRKHAPTPRRDCPAGHVLTDSGRCRKGCAEGMRLSADHCCWDGQHWNDRKRSCIGKPRCPAAMVALPANSGCTPKLAPLATNDLTVRLIDAVPGARDPALMVWIPAGPFIRGAAGNTQLDDIPQQIIELSAFALDREEVTVARYRRCVAAGACEEPAPHDSKDASARACNWGRDGREAHPVNCVGIGQAWRFCLWAGKRLPTEAEWEKAARGVDGRLYPWGNNKPRCEQATYYHGERHYLSLDGSPSPPAGKDYCQEGTTPAAAQTNVSPYGVVQMAGNVSEWVADWHAADYYKRCPTNDPRGPRGVTTQRGFLIIDGPTQSVGKALVRGGSWADSWDRLQTTYRQAVPFDVQDSTIGFRCAVSRAQPEIQ